MTPIGRRGLVPPDEAVGGSHLHLDLHGPSQTAQASVLSVRPITLGSQNLVGRSKPADEYGPGTTFDAEWANANVLGTGAFCNGDGLMSRS